MTRNISEAAVCCSSASERCLRASASSRVRTSSCFFNSTGELGPLLTRSAAFVPDERSLRPRVGLFAPLRDKVTSSAQPLVPSGQPSVSILTEPHDEFPALHSITSSARASSVGGVPAVAGGGGGGFGGLGGGGFGGFGGSMGQPIQLIRSPRRCAHHSARTNQSLTRRTCASSPIMPRRNRSTQTTKIVP